jgi:hypothetical protein
MRATTIYALIDPLTGHVRYVGKTIGKINKRLREHINYARNGAQTHCASWIRSVLERELRPEIIELEVTEYDWREAEQFWIANMRFIGCDLTNHAIGGDGCGGYQHTEEAKQRIGAAGKGRKPRPETIELMRKKVFTEEHRRNISAARKGAVISPEQREKIAASLRGRRPTEETRAKLRAKVISEDHRRKISESNKRSWALRRAQAQT